MQKDARTVGENALQRVIRLLKTFNQKMVEDGEQEGVQLQLNASESGSLVLVSSEGNTEEIYNFNTLEQLNTYLNACPLKQILLSRR